MAATRPGPFGAAAAVQLWEQWESPPRDIEIRWTETLKIYFLELLLSTQSENQLRLGHNPFPLLFFSPGRLPRNSWLDLISGVRPSILSASTVRSRSLIIDLPPMPS